MAKKPKPDLGPPWIIFSENGHPVAILPAGRPGEVANVGGVLSCRGPLDVPASYLVFRPRCDNKCRNRPTQSEVIASTCEFCLQKTRALWPMRTMCRVRCEHVMDGPGPNEKVVKIQESSGGWEEVIASTDRVKDGRLETSSIMAYEGKVLVELPTESASGKWRLWVQESDTKP